MNAICNLIGLKLKTRFQRSALNKCRFIDCITIVH
uniref:Uncharacterized protein n=1 Tax=Anguilla anguilla TaxID=7936 RepID=A0A0E9UB82_ANGAN